VRPAPAAAPPGAGPTEARLPVDLAVVHPVYGLSNRTGERPLFEAPGGAAAVGCLPPEPNRLAGAFVVAREQAKRGPVQVRTGFGLHLLAAGPVLNSGDRVTVQRLVRRGNQLELELTYTDRSAEGAESRRNVRWVPLVQVPADLAPGPYHLRVTWSRVSLAPGARPAPAAPRRDSVALRVVAGAVNESKVERVNEADFQAVTQKTWPVPRPGQAVSIDLGLRVHNRAAREKKFSLFNTVWLSIRTASGKICPLHSERAGAGGPASPLILPAGRTGLISRQGKLAWGEERSADWLRLSWEDGNGGAHSFFELRPGRYTLHIAYAVPPPEGRLGPSAWVGKLEEVVVPFEIEPGPPGGAAGAKGRAEAWSALADPDERRAHWAAWALEAHPAEALALFKERLRPAAPFDFGKVAPLLADLDSDSFAVREKASAGLVGLGYRAAGPLKKALAGKPSLETRRRIECILAVLEKEKRPADVRRPVRAVELLERIGTPAARQLLAALAKGDAEAPQTQMARLALARLTREAP
jgi:hypothetical protein